MQRNGKVVNERALDLSTPEVAAWCESEIARCIERYGLDMYRIDHNRTMTPSGFRIHVLRDLCPQAKIAAIHRDGRDVVSSWGRKQNRWEQFGGYEPAIKMMARRWNEAISAMRWPPVSRAAISLRRWGRSGWVTCPTSR
jgi:hypothetical protein